MPNDHEDTRAQFDETVNMTAEELRRWLDTDESKSVGQKSEDGGESTGHASGRRIVELLEKTELTEDDYAHMRKVVGYAHLTRPSNGTRSRWPAGLVTAPARPTRHGGRTVP